MIDGVTWVLWVFLIATAPMVLYAICEALWERKR